jgi:hypothetical protein
MKQCWPGSVYYISKLTVTLAAYFRRLIEWSRTNKVCFFKKYKPNSSRRSHVVTFPHTRKEYFVQDL